MARRSREPRADGGESSASSELSRVMGERERWMRLLADEPTVEPLTKVLDDESFGYVIDFSTGGRFWKLDWRAKGRRLAVSLFSRKRRRDGRPGKPTLVRRLPEREPPDG
jgi:hypothetical protein